MSIAEKKLGRILALKKEYVRQTPQNPDEFYKHIKNLYGADPRTIPGFEGWLINADLRLEVLSKEWSMKEVRMPNLVDIWQSVTCDRYILEFTLTNPMYREGEREAHQMRAKLESV